MEGLKLAIAFGYISQFYHGKVWLVISFYDDGNSLMG